LSGTDGDVDDLLDGLARGPARWRAGAAVDAPADATSARFSPDGHHVTATKGAALWVWDFATGSTVLEWRPGRRFLDRIMPVLDIAFSPDGRHAATSFAPRVFLWDLARGSLVREVQHAADARQAPEILGFAPDGRLLTAVLTDGRRVIHGWSTSSGAESSRLVLERTLTYQLVDRGRRVLTCDPDGLVELRDLDGGEAAKWPTGMRRPVLAVSGDGRRCGATSGRHAAMFELTTGRWIAHVEDGSIGGTSIRLNHGGTHALLDRRVAVARSLWTAGGASSELRKVGWQSAFNADGRRLASASEEEVEIVDLPAAVTTASLLHRSPVSGIAFVAGGTELATRAREQGVRTFACDGGRQLDVLGQQLGYGQLIATEGGDRLAAPGGGSLRLWERVPA
jgi:WD40 repeat protein